MGAATPHQHRVRLFEIKRTPMHQMLNHLLGKCSGEEAREAALNASALIGTERLHICRAYDAGLGLDFEWGKCSQAAHEFYERNYNQPLPQ